MPESKRECWRASFSIAILSHEFDSAFLNGVSYLNPEVNALLLHCYSFPWVILLIWNIPEYLKTCDVHNLLNSVDATVFLEFDHSIIKFHPEVVILALPMNPDVFTEVAVMDMVI